VAILCGGIVRETAGGRSLHETVPSRALFLNAAARGDLRLACHSNTGKAQKRAALVNFLLINLKCSKVVLN